MADVWFSLKKSMKPCKLWLCDVHAPDSPSRLCGSATKKPERYDFSSFNSSFRETIKGRKRRTRTRRSSMNIGRVHQLNSQLRRLSDHRYSPSMRRSDSNGDQFNGALNLHCRKCGELRKKHGAIESHHPSMHAVTELGEGDSSRKVVEIICQRRWLKNEEHELRQIDQIFKVNNTEKTLSEFEEHREMVKTKASKLAIKLPRCLADGNEHLRFHCTTMACSLGLDQSRRLCTSNRCGVCSILSRGFSEKWFNGKACVFTSGSSGRAFESVSLCGTEGALKKALMVCRVVAGRIVNGDFEESRERFDSVGGKLSGDSKFDDELFVVNPRGLLPCFVVTYKF